MVFGRLGDQVLGAFFISVGALLTGWGLFIHLNRSAEELEPEAMQEAKGEDHKLQ